MGSWDQMGTMGTSDGLAGNAWAPFFGYPQGIDPAQPADKNKRYTHQDMTEAYAGKRNRYMQTAILGLAHLDNNLYGSFSFLPFPKTDCFQHDDGGPAAPVFERNQLRVERPPL